MAKHCLHPNQKAENPNAQKICCNCPAVVNFRLEPHPEHGPYADWLFKPNPEPIEPGILEEECNGVSR